MKKTALLSLSLLMASAACCVHAEPVPAATGQDASKPVEQVVVSKAGLYGDWRMVLPDFPGFDKPIVGDFCDFKKQGEDVSITCADGFMQDIPEVTLNGDKLRLRWGGALNHTIYDAVWDGNETFDGELIQAQMGVVNHRFKAKMERVLDQQAAGAPQQSLTVLNNYFDDLTSKSIREKYYEDEVYKSMKKAVAKGAYARAGFTAKYFGKILEVRGQGVTYPDVFKVSNSANAEQWCLARVDKEGLADVRCSDIR